MPFLVNEFARLQQAVTDAQTAVDAIARLQKNYSMRVTGMLNDPVRRALHMP